MIHKEFAGDDKWTGLGEHRRMPSQKHKPSLPPNVEEDPAWLRAEPEGGTVPPPVEVRAGRLPFLARGWKNFERLCCRLAGASGLVEKARVYGTPGQKQYGIDILVRLNDGAYEVWQTKRYETARPGDIDRAVEIFLAHAWAEKARRLVLAFACPLESTGINDAIERGRAQLGARNIVFEPFDAGDLTNELIIQPEIIDDFFGRAWVERVCPPEALDRLKDRLSVPDRLALRERLRTVYASWIAAVDPGLPIANLGRLGKPIPALPIQERFVEPDILVRSRHGQSVSAPPADERQQDQPPGEPQANIGVDKARDSPRPRTVSSEQRVALDGLLDTERRIIITGEAGSGKTTLLRAVALDLLAEQPRFPAIQKHYAGFVPIWVPFALWARMATGGAAPPALEAAVVAFLEARGEPELGSDAKKVLLSGRALLLVDGIDEAQDPVAARTIAALLFAQADARQLPVIATSRPHGLRTLGALPAAWPVASLAPLNERQRGELAHLWFRVIETLEQEDDVDPARIAAQSQSRTRAFMEALDQSPGIASLSATPLFLLALLGLHRHGKALPRSRLAAIEEVVAQLVEHQPRRREVAALATARLPGLQPRQRDRILDDFAYALHAAELGGDTPDAASVEATITRAGAMLTTRQPGLGIDQAEEMASEIFAFAEERAGLLSRKTTDAVGFVHLSFQEFLAARHINHRPLGDRIEFVRTHAAWPRWREPILYLLHLTRSEAEVGELIQSIAAAPFDDETGRWTRDALLTDATFADLAHDIPVVTAIADRLFAEVESFAFGKRETHLLSASVDGLHSEALGTRCVGKLSQWLPNRHGWGRAAALRAMPGWSTGRHPECIPVLMRSLYADEETTRQAAGEMLSVLAEGNADIKSDLLSRLAGAPSPSAIASLLYALCCGWNKDAETGRLAALARGSVDRAIAVEAIRIRAVRNESDEADLDRFYGMLATRHIMRGLPHPWLVQHFVDTQRDRFIDKLACSIGSPEHKNPHDLKPLVGALIMCDAEHPLVKAGLRALLSQNWLHREIFGPDGFPADRIKWTSGLLETVEGLTQKEKAYFPNYDFYWVAKRTKIESLKPRFIADLKQDRNGFKFWSAKALVEVWGSDDPEVRGVLLPFMDAAPADIALVAHLLPAIVGDAAACRKAFLAALHGPVERADFLFPALREVGVRSDDDEAFAVCMKSREAMKAPIYLDQWREQMILTFPGRIEVRNMALGELRRRDGEIGAVALSYRGDDEMISSMLGVLVPLQADARLALVASLRKAGVGDPRAFDLIDAAREDTDGSVSSEATIGSTEIKVAQHVIDAADIDRLNADLETVGPDYEARRCAAAIALGVAGRLDVFAAKTERAGPLEIPISRSALRGDDRYLRRILGLWPRLLVALDDPEVAMKRFGLTAETTLDLLDPIYPNARQLYDALMKTIDAALNVQPRVLMGAVAKFEPASERLRGLVLSQLVPKRVVDYQAGLLAAEIFADQFADDREMRSDVLESFRKNPHGAAAGALAELAVRHPAPELTRTLRERAIGERYDLPTHFRLMAALASADNVVEDAREQVTTFELSAEPYRTLTWPSALSRRVIADKELQSKLSSALVGIPSATVRMALLSWIHGAIGVDGQLRPSITRELVRESEQAIPTAVFDVSSGSTTTLRQMLGTFLE